MSAADETHVALVDLVMGPIADVLPCTCGPEYLDRDLIAPDCPQGQYQDDVAYAVASTLIAAGWTPPAATSSSLES